MFVLHESYADVDKDLDEHSHLLYNFVKNSSTLYYTRYSELEIKKLDQACHITDLALKRFDQLKPNYQQALTHLIQMTIDQPLIQCSDQPTSDYYKKILSIIFNSGLLKQNLCQISCFLTDNYINPPFFKNLSTIYLLADFAIHYFNYLSDMTKERVSQTYQLSKLPPLLEIKHTQDKIEIYNHIQSIFKKFEIIQREKKSVISVESNQEFTKPILVKEKRFSLKQLTEEDFQTMEILSSELELTTRNREGTELSQHHQKQMEKMQLIFQDILSHYLPMMMNMDSSSTFSPYLTKILEQIHQQFPTFAPCYLFKANKVVSLSEKEQNILFSLCQQLSLFLTAFNRDALYKKEDKVTITDKIDQLTKEIAQLLIEQLGMKSSSPLLYLAPNSLALLIAYGLDRLFSPSCLFILIERLLIDHLNLNIEEIKEKKPPLQAFSINSQLNQKLGKIFLTIAQELAFLGNPQGPAAAAIKGCLIVLNTNKENLVEKMQQFISQTKCSSSHLFPLVVLHHLLFRQDKRTLIPTFEAFLTAIPNTQENLHHQKNLKEKILKKFYPLIITLIKDHSSIAGWIVDQSTSLKNFYEQLIHNLWKIIENKEYLQILSLYFLRGLKQGLIDKDNNTSSHFT